MSISSQSAYQSSPTTLFPCRSSCIHGSSDCLHANQYLQAPRLSYTDRVWNQSARNKSSDHYQAPLTPSPLQLPRTIQIEEPPNQNAFRKVLIRLPQDANLNPALNPLLSQIPPTQTNSCRRVPLSTPETPSISSPHNTPNLQTSPSTNYPIHPKRRHLPPIKLNTRNHSWPIVQTPHSHSAQPGFESPYTLDHVFGRLKGQLAVKRTYLQPKQ